MKGPKTNESQTDEEAIPFISGEGINQSSKQSKFDAHGENARDSDIHIDMKSEATEERTRSITSTDPNPSAYEKASFFNAMHYYYAIKNVASLQKKDQQDLKLEDFPLLGKTEEVSYKINELEETYLQHRIQHKKPSLFWPIMKVFGSRIFKQQFLTIIYCAARILFTLFLSKMLESIAGADENATFHWGIYLFLATIISLYANHFSYFQGARLVSQLRPALIGMMYRKITRLNYFSVNQVSIGKIVNIAANELNILEFQIYHVFYLTISPFVLAGSLAVLWMLVGVACLPGIAFILLTGPIQYALSKLSAKMMGKKNPITDERVKLTNEMVEGIRLLKMYGWETHYAENVEKIRNKEVSLLKKIGYCDFVSGHLLGRLSIALGSFLIFLTYSALGGTLTTSKVYATIIMLIFLRVSTVLYCSGALRFINELKMTFKRIIDLLEIEEPSRPNRDKNVVAPLNSKNGVEFENFYAYWGEKPSHDAENKLEGHLTFENPTLKRVTFSVEKGTLCALIGTVGSGKSTALLSFLNEIPKREGSLRYNGRIAYVEQEAVIFPGTLRSNILFGRPYNAEKYDDIVESCCLRDDFAGFPNGDLTEIGEKGVNLSGGQKARTALARALYSDADIYLLDDPLSAVDAKVAHKLFAKAIRGVLRDKTVLLATHQLHFARQAEKIVVFDSGQVKVEGTFDQIKIKDATIFSQLETKDKENPVENDTALTEDQKIRRRRQLSESSLKEDDDEKEPTVDEVSLHDIDDDDQEREEGKLVSQEKIDSSEVGLGTYWHYLKNAGSFGFILFFFINLALIEVLYVGYTRLLGYWIAGTWDSSFAIKVLGILIVVFLLALATREIFFVNFSLNASKNLHTNMLKYVINAAIEFFDTNPSGRIINRFSNDMGVLDRFLLMVQNDLIDGYFYFAAILITVFIIVPWILLPTLLVIILLVFIVRALKKAIVQGRAIELLSRSPIYSLLSQTLSGLVIIRVYNQEKSVNQDFTNLLNSNTRAFNFLFDTTRIFTFYCDLVASLFAWVGIVIILYMNIEPYLVGLAFCYLLSLTDHVQFVLRQTITHTVQMSSTARVKAYTLIPQEAALSLTTDKQKGVWPSRGEVNFNNVYMKYRQNTDHVIKGLTFSTKSAERIGCVGRTGAGKSSIIQALFRLVEIDRQAVPDSSIKIDDVDTSTVGLHALRKRISIIPQTPFIFTGTIRANLDPLREHSDTDVIGALEETNLWKFIKALPDGLDTIISNTSSMFSVGQKQLVCLARILLQNNKIVVLDEATSQVDFETDIFIQNKIMSRFKNSTIFTIAHRLSTVANYDRVLVMSHGRAVELDHPYKLLTKNVGDESITKTDGIFATMVMNTGALHSKLIFEIAKKSYFENDQH